MQKLVEAGELTEEEAEHSERRNIILQALGPEQNIRVDLTHQAVRRGDTLVLCSDGLSSQVGKDAIAEVVTEYDDIEVACQKLIDLANAKGGPDNITVIIARFEGSGLFSSRRHGRSRTPSVSAADEPHSDGSDRGVRHRSARFSDGRDGSDGRDPGQRDRRSRGRTRAAAPAAIVSGGDAEEVHAGEATDAGARRRRLCQTRGAVLGGRFRSDCSGCLSSGRYGLSTIG